MDGVFVRLCQSQHTANTDVCGVNGFCSLAGVWLLARCADLQGLGYSIGSFWACLGALVTGGLAARAAAIVAMYTLHRDRIC